MRNSYLDRVKQVDFLSALTKKNIVLSVKKIEAERNAIKSELVDFFDSINSPCKIKRSLTSFLKNPIKENIVLVGVAAMFLLKFLKSLATSCLLCFQHKRT